MEELEKMKKYVKYICIIILILIIIWVTIFAINFARISNFKKPILMKENYIKSVQLYVDKEKEEHSLYRTYYKGIGYRIDTLYEKDDVYHAEIYFFNKLIKKIQK